MPPRYPIYGILNDIEAPKIVDRIDIEKDSSSNILRTVLDKTYSSNSIQNTGPYKGIVLRIEKTAEPGSWIEQYYSLFSSTDKKPKFIAIRVRIPELHAMYPIPETLGADSTQPSVIDLYPIFYSQDDSRQVLPKVGTLVWVDFGNKTNFTDPIYIRPVDINQTAPAIGSNISAKKTHNCIKPLESDSYLGDRAAYVNKPSSVTGIPIEVRVNQVEEENAVIKSSQVSSETYYRWKKSLDKNNVKGKTYIWVSKNNSLDDTTHLYNKRENIIFAPHNVQYDNELEVIVFFHDLDGFHGSTDFSHIYTRIFSELIEQNRNFIFILPELSWSYNSYDKNSNILNEKVFNKGFNVFYNECLDVIKKNYYNKELKIKYTSFIFHGAGGASCIGKFIKTNIFNLLSPNRIILSSSSYKKYLEELYDNYLVNKKDVISFSCITQKDSICYNNMQQFLKNKIEASGLDNFLFDSIEEADLYKIAIYSTLLKNKSLSKEITDNDTENYISEKEITTSQDFDLQEGEGAEKDIKNTYKNSMPERSPGERPLQVNLATSSDIYVKTSKTNAAQGVKISEAQIYKEARISVSDFGVLTSASSLLVAVPSVDGRQERLHRLAARRFMQLNAAWTQENPGYPPILIVSGWREHRWSSEKQYTDFLIKQYGTVEEGRKYLAFNSPHETGLALDIGNNGLYPGPASSNQAQRKTKLYNWLYLNAHKYGFTPYKQEAWHWECRVPKQSWVTGDEFTNNFAIRVENVGNSNNAAPLIQTNNNCVELLSNVINIGDNFFIDDTKIKAGDSAMLNNSDKKSLIVQLANSLGIEPEVAYSFFSVESGGKSGICESGRPLIRFEPHVFANPQRMKKYGVSEDSIPWFSNGNSKLAIQKWEEMGFKHGSICSTNYLEYKSLTYAIKINEMLAYDSISIGAAQIMGYNCSMVGFRNSKEMFLAYSKGEEEQIKGFFRYVQKRGGGELLSALKQKDFVKAAKLYNGIGKEQQYASKLDNYYNIYKSKGLPA